MKSAQENKEVMSRYIDEELKLNRLIRFSLATDIFIAPLSESSQKKRGNKWRLIVDLSSPKGASINNGISSALTSIRYASIDDTVQTIHRLGNGTLMAKLDLKAAYRSVPIHPDNPPLLGTHWKEAIYVDTALPFFGAKDFLSGGRCSVVGHALKRH